MESFVVTGGSRGIGRAIVARLRERGHVVVVDRDADGPADGLVVGDAGDPLVAAAAAEEAARHGRLAGWVNNAAVFRDAA